MTGPKKGVYSIVINAPIERVWREITKTDELINCFFGSWLDTPGLQPGAPIRMRTPSKKYTGVVGEVLEFDPPNRFKHTFKFTQLDEAPVEVTYQLSETEGGTEVSLIHEHVIPGTKTQKYMDGGVKFILNTLKADAEDKPHSFNSRFILLMCRITEPLAKKIARSENWPFDRKIA